MSSGEERLDLSAGIVCPVNNEIAGPLGEIGARSVFVNSGSVEQKVASGGGSAPDLPPLDWREVARMAVAGGQWAVGSGRVTSGEWCVASEGCGIRRTRT